MRMSIFGDVNFSSLHCYLENVLVFGLPKEEASTEQEPIFLPLRANNLKLSPKKRHVLCSSVCFLRHVVDRAGVSVDQGKVRVTSAPDLMLLVALTAGRKRNSKAFFLVDDRVPFKKLTPQD